MAISFNGPNKQITLSAGTVTLNVLDLWSRWVDWFLTEDNSKYGIWFLQIGGNDIDETQGTSIPIYIFQDATVSIKPQEANHTLSVTGGILVLAGGGDPFMDTTEDYTVRINYQQPVQAITVSTGGTVAPSAGAMRDAVGLASASLDTQLGGIQTDTDFALKIIKNKKELKKNGSTWELIIYDDDDYTPILNKEMKDKDGNNITDLAAGVLAQELTNSV